MHGYGGINDNVQNECCSVPVLPNKQTATIQQFHRNPPFTPVISDTPIYFCNLGSDTPRYFDERKYMRR